jgi:nuclear pore complex protein Nup85
LLQKLEEISIRTAQGSGDDYLSVLRRTTKGGGEKDALGRLKAVRLALARYFARCTVIGVGGKHIVDHSLNIVS